MYALSRNPSFLLFLFFSSGKIFNTLSEKELISYLTNSSVFAEDIAEWEPSASATYSPLIRFIFVNLLMNGLDTV